MTSTKKSLFTSAIALVLCFAMLVGTTFAWFTDEVTSSGNIIQTGKLDANMYWSEELLPTDTDNPVADGWNNAAKSKVFEYNNWEPGFSQFRYVLIENAGSLDFKWHLTIDADGKVTELAEVIDVYYITPGANGVSKADLNENNYVGTLDEVLARKDSNDGVLKSGERVLLAIAFHMQETAGNEYQNKALCEGGFSLNLIAAQASATGENDSFDDLYDEDAEWPYLSIKYNVGKTLSDDQIKKETNDAGEEVSLLNAPLSLGDSTDDIFANIPSGVTLADGADKLTLTVTYMEKPNADVNTTSRDEILRSIDIHVDGIAEDNTVPMTFVLKELFPKGLNENNVKLYHVEGNETKEMTYASNPTNHNEFSYDPATGDAIITIASFSEVATYADTDAGWDGKTFDYSWYKADGDLTINNANQFAAFRNIVDGVEINGVYTIDDFYGQKITLTADINLNGHLFDPIGWGYDNKAWNRTDANGNRIPGKVFKGHFDGDNHTIYGLFQNGWDLEAATGTIYTYTNCGFGLFASALDATFENLNIDGADIRVECVETGVLVGLAQGKCTFRNINILGCRAANYQRPVGGVVGEVSPKMVNGVAQEGDASKHTFYNVYVDSNTVVGSMWGDFDAPVGGVIGAYWDDAGKTTVVMNKVTVACRLDVYNDVTSTYQWYAYRRAGMLIGNTDRSEKNENGTNIASTKINGTEYLTCSNVTVYYGDWTDYHYCEFNKANPNWPWVRVEPGEYCDGYSNPRWGRPIDPVTGGPVTDSVHEHGENEGHLEPIPFHQLYGGGQGVYGNPSHTGVSEGIYTVTYMDHGEVLHVDYVTDNTKAYDCSHVDGSGIWPTTEVKDANNNSPSYWVKADNSQFAGVNAGNTANVIVYPKWPNEYTVRCLDTYGNVAYYAFVTDDNTTNAEYEAIAKDINNTLSTIQNEVDKDKKVMIIVWEKADGTTINAVNASDIKNSVKEKKDFIIAAVPQLQDTSITLERVYDDTTGELIAYKVTKVKKGDDNTSVVIPDYVGKIPVTLIQDGAAEGFDKLHAVTIPDTMKYIGKNAFADAPSYLPVIGTLNKLETQTFYYDGDPNKFNEQLQKHLDNGESEMFSRLWDSGLGDGSRIFFLKEGKINLEAGYWELTEANIKRGGSWPSYKVASEEYVWTQYKGTISGNTLSDFLEEYAGECDCGCGTRPDISYWTWVVNYNANYDGATEINSGYVVDKNSIKTFPTNPTRNGYRFDGWYTSANGGTKVDASYVPTSDITLYAHWTEN